MEKTEPPPVVKCVPAYQRPVGIPWRQGLKEKRNMLARWLAMICMIFVLLSAALWLGFLYCNDEEGT